MSLVELGCRSSAFTRSRVERPGNSITLFIKRNFARGLFFVCTIAAWAHERLASPENQRFTAPTRHSQPLYPTTAVLTREPPSPVSSQAIRKMILLLTIAATIPSPTGRPSLEDSISPHPHRSASRYAR